MPFDFHSDKEPEAVRILKAAKARISDPANWCGHLPDKGPNGPLCAEVALSIEAGLVVTWDINGEVDHWNTWHVETSPAGSFLYAAANEMFAKAPWRVPWTPSQRCWATCSRICSATATASRPAVPGT